ncbi:hypothetical protein KKF84_19790 [Myxococcota bacterium]|nr:hypothetical protein [Myxococcota bacterium]MBU1537566.1 hypothetical protein [Myxococcota bacterium]
MRSAIFILLFILFSGCESSSTEYVWNNDGGPDAQNNLTDGGSDASDADGDVVWNNDPPPLLAGTWAQKQILASTINYPMIGPVDTFHINYLRVEISQDGTNLIALEETCEIIIEADTEIQTTVIPEAFVQSMSMEPKPAFLEATPQGHRFVQPEYWQVQGVNLTDIPQEELPTEASDPRVFDQDEDGHPGLTVRMTGMLTGELYIISREWTHLTSGIASTEGFTGLVDWEGSQITLGASTEILNTTPESVTHADPSLSNFMYVPVETSMTCAEIIAQKAVLFPEQ